MLSQPLRNSGDRLAHNSKWSVQVA